MIDIKDIKKLQNIFSGDDIEEIEIRSGKDAVRIISGQKVNPADKLAARQAMEASALSSGAPAPSDKPVLQESGQVFELRSLWIGFFTRLNPKTGENYIKLRDIVKKGGLVGHVRVLGVLQDIRSEVSGKVKEVLVEEGQPIEYGQPVMRFEVQG